MSTLRKTRSTPTPETEIPFGASSPCQHLTASRRLTERNCGVCEPRLTRGRPGTRGSPERVAAARRTESAPRPGEIPGWHEAPQWIFHLRVSAGGRRSTDLRAAELPEQSVARARRRRHRPEVREGLGRDR